MDQLTTYRAKGKEIGLIFLFKYCLNGNLKLFEIAEGVLTPAQEDWLFNSKHFPSTEEKMKYWIKNPKFIKIFIVEKSPAVLTFEALWELYDHKIKKHESENKFKKLKEAEVIKCFIAVPHYKKYLQRKGVAQTNLATFIHQKYYEDDYSKV